MINEIKIIYNTKFIKNGLILTPIMIALAIIWLDCFNYLENRSINYVLSFDNTLFYIAYFAIFLLSCFIKLILILFIFMMISGTIHAAYLLLYPVQLAVVLNKHGIWIHRYGFIKWDNIDSVSIYKSTGILESIAIKFINTYSVFKQASLSGKLTIIYSKIFKYPLALGHLDIDNETFLNYVKLFKS